MRAWENDNGWRLVLTVAPGQGARLTLLQGHDIKLTETFEANQVADAEERAYALVDLGEMRRVP